jgi:hypothetical protein
MKALVCDAGEGTQPPPVAPHRTGGLHALLPAARRHPILRRRGPARQIPLLVPPRPRRPGTLRTQPACCPAPFRKAVQPCRDSLVVGCECMPGWYGLADTCRENGIPYALGHAWGHECGARSLHLAWAARAAGRSAAGRRRPAPAQRSPGRPASAATRLAVAHPGVKLVVYRLRVAAAIASDRTGHSAGAVAVLARRGAGAAVRGNPGDAAVAALRSRCRCTADRGRRRRRRQTPSRPGRPRGRTRQRQGRPPGTSSSSRLRSESPEGGSDWQRRSSWLSPHREREGRTRHRGSSLYQGDNSNAKAQPREALRLLDRASPRRKVSSEADRANGRCPSRTDSLPFLLLPPLDQGANRRKGRTVHARLPMTTRGSPGAGRALSVPRDG